MPSDPEADAGDLSRSIQPGAPPKGPPSPETVRRGMPPAPAQAPLSDPDRNFNRSPSSAGFDSPAPVRERSTALFDTVLIAPHTHPIWGILFAVAGVAVLAGFLAGGQPKPAGVLAPPLFVMALALLRGWAMPVRYTFRPEGIEVNRPRRLIRYEEIQHVVRIERGRRAVVEVLLADGHVRLAATRDSAATLEEFLESQPRDPPVIGDVPARFTAFLKQQQLVSPPDEIFVFHGGQRQVSPRTRRYRRASWWLLLLTATWIALGAIDRTPMFPAFAALSGLFALIFLAGGYTPLRHSHLGFKIVKDAILIITPTAIALQQGDLCGELRWPELLSVSPYGLGSSRSLDLSGLTLKVRGASILLVDVYHWPLVCAAELIRDYSGR